MPLLKGVTCLVLAEETGDTGGEAAHSLLLSAHHAGQIDLDATRSYREA